MTFRELADAKGKGYQTLINEALRHALAKGEAEPVTVATLRQVLREELHIN